MPVYLIRHPQPIEARGLCYGRRDLPVERDAVVAVAAAIRGRIPAAILSGAQIFSSPLARCFDLARELASPGKPITCDDLIEMDFGTWEGKSWEAVPRDELNAWAADVWGYRPGGGESAAMAADRWRRWSRALRPRACMLGITHAGIMRVALACSGKLRGPSFASFPIAFGSVHQIALGEYAIRRHA
jgi:alpha-ribazole phosphatase